jgi:WD40-like Beta Propeller Repeat
MRIIRNLLILCVLMVGLLFAARQFSAGTGKGEVLSYLACPAVNTTPCMPRILDTRTMMVMGFNLQHARDVFWTENGDLYTITGDNQTNSHRGLYRWGKKIFSEKSDSTSVMELIRNENNRLAFSALSDDGWKIRIWDSVGWAETILPPRFDPYFKSINWHASGRFNFILTDYETGYSEIYAWDGVRLINLGQYTYGPDYDSPTWSPDGRLAFTSERDGNREIYVWDGTTLTNISRYAADDYDPAWSPDGRLAFTSERDGNREIYVWDGKTLIRINQTPEDEAEPVWSEEGELAFIAGGKNVYIWGQNGLRLTNFKIAGPTTDLSWISGERLLFHDEGRYVFYVWDDDVIIRLFTDEIIQYGDKGIAFVSVLYHLDDTEELYILDGKNVVGTGLVGSQAEFEDDGKGGLRGMVCNDKSGCDLYRWKDGRARRIINSLGIGYHFSLRP